MKIVNDQGGLTKELSYAAAIDSSGKSTWVEASLNQVHEDLKVLQADKTPWSEDLNFYNPYIADKDSAFFPLWYTSLLDGTMYKRY